MSDRPCMLNPEKWRVAKWGTLTYAWGVWPPAWDIEHDPPIVFFPTWRRAFRSAWDRAQFAASPERPSNIGRPLNGEA